MCRARIIVLALALFACNHHETPTSPPSSLDCRPVMGALTDATLTGHVTFSDGRPAAGARIRFEKSDQQYQFTALADNTGSYRAGDALWSGTPYLTFLYAPGESQPTATTMTVLGCYENVRDFVIPASRCTYVTGTVSDNPYSRIPGARISFAGFSTWSANDGSYVLQIGCPPLQVGSASRLVVSHPDYQSYSSDMTIPETSITVNVMLVRK